ncbi:hypothetical protein BOTBODRAFT_582867 [Botryobasidium botryosum FD-172 SS1]|uniref:Uncharacterized protein n=1 Tax=Botryobasidium botryosum (strain FD-172 SS1) TaxID=930990 RepID=A0A067MPV5_BOTB1|nr:hypothetical protein BOTBODRAFT_582867 [Botryobasidium botryosum FD-172 SS1]
MCLISCYYPWNYQCPTSRSQLRSRYTPWTTAVGARSRRHCPCPTPRRLRTKGWSQPTGLSGRVVAQTMGSTFVKPCCQFRRLRAKSSSPRAQRKGSTRRRRDAVWSVLLISGGLAASDLGALWRCQSTWV